MNDNFGRGERKPFSERRLRSKQGETQDRIDSISSPSEPGETKPQPPKKKPFKRPQPERKIRARKTQAENYARLTVSLPEVMIRNLKLLGVVSDKTISQLVEELLLPAIDEIELTQTEA